MTLTVDRREKALSQCLGVSHHIADLPVGDVHYRLQDGVEWVLERKTAHDLAASIKSGRWSEQLSRLHGAGYQKVFFVVEGDLRQPLLGLQYAAMLSAIVNEEHRPDAHVFRSVDVEETAAIVRQLVKKGGSTIAVPTGNAPAKPLTKRKRDADKSTIFVRQMMVIPTISENVSKKLVEHFGTLRELQNALETPKKFPKIALDDKRSVGTARVKLLAEYLL